MSSRHAFDSLAFDSLQIQRLATCRRVRVINPSEHDFDQRVIALSLAEEGRNRPRQLE